MNGQNCHGEKKAVNMKILYLYSTDRITDICFALHNLGYTVEEYDRKLENNRLNDEEIELLSQYVKAHGITHLMSTHLIYNAAMAAYQTGIKYISIIWDAPYIKMYTPFGKMDNCWFSVFDRIDAERFRKAGLKHVLYQPLAVNPYEIKKWNLPARTKGRYFNDICFIGSLYSGNAYDKELGNAPSSLQRYFESIFEEAAFRWDGQNRIYGKTSPEIVKYLEMAVPEFELANVYDLEDCKVFEINYLVRKLANIERTCVLNMLAEYFNVTCHTYEEAGRERLSGKLIKGHTGSYQHKQKNRDNNGISAESIAHLQERLGQRAHFRTKLYKDLAENRKHLDNEHKDDYQHHNDHDQRVGNCRADAFGNGLLTLVILGKGKQNRVQVAGFLSKRSKLDHIIGKNAGLLQSL